MRGKWVLVTPMIISPSRSGRPSPVRTSNSCLSYEERSGDVFGATQRDDEREAAVGTPSERKTSYIRGYLLGEPIDLVPFVAGVCGEKPLSTEMCTRLMILEMRVRIILLPEVLE